jgi:hypothetical protein
VLSKTTAVAVQEQRSLLPAEEQPNMLQVIARAAASPDVDVAKMQALLDMQFQLQNKQAEMEFNAALNRIQAKLPRISKNGKHGGTGARYALFEDIDKEVRPLLTAEGLALTYGSNPSADGKLTVTCTLRHVMGHSVTQSLPVPADTGSGRNAVQAIGSAITYARRYLVALILNLVMEGEDDDGRGGKAKPITEQQIRQLEDMLEAVAPDRAQFLKYMAVAKISDLNQEGFARAMTALKAKAAKRA